jgi:capsid protein
MDRRPIRGSYDAARDGVDNANHWANADAYSADATNSLAVRRKLVRRSRYETENNGQGKGLILTQANYVVGRGPKLRLRTKSQGFNAMVERAWVHWYKAVRFASKLRTQVKAKVGDGEGFLIVRSNPMVADEVKLDIVPIECEQCSSPGLYGRTEGRIDGMWFDEFGNPTHYDILKHHPGSSFTSLQNDVEKIPAQFVLHLFRGDRPGQHRGIPEIASTLSLFAQGRRFREATVAAAETCANISMMIRTNAPAETDPMPIAPFSTVPMEKNTIMALPLQWQSDQMRPEHPSATHTEFTRSMQSEQARPLNMPYNIAACDSSGYSFSGGKLDHLTYFVSIDVEQGDIEDQVLEPLFVLWFGEAVRTYGWVPIDQPAGQIPQRSIAPPRSWAWPPRPQIDDGKTANARKTNLGSGIASLEQLLTEDGIDYEDHVIELAENYGVTVDEIKRALFQVNVLAPVGAQPATVQPGPADDPNGDDPNDKPPPRRNGNTPSNANGNGRFAHA